MTEKGSGPKESSTRLHVILARKAPIGVVFRRGPSKQVAVLTWDTDRHEFRLGQWFKGRIYERRCGKLKFKAVESPPEAKRWGGQPLQGEVVRR